MALPLIAILVGLIALGVLVSVVAVYRQRKGQVDTNYRALCIMGIAWLPVGIATRNPGLWGMGIIFLFVGLANRDKWKDEKKWSDLTPVERRTKLILVAVLGVLLVASLAAFFWMRRPS